MSKNRLWHSAVAICLWATTWLGVVSLLSSAEPEASDGGRSAVAPERGGGSGESVLRMSSQEFNEWIRKAWADCGQGKQAPTLMSQAVKDRLKAGKPTSDEAVTYTVGAWTRHENSYLTTPPKALSWKETQNLHKGTYRLIDELIELVPGRWLLQAQLCATKALLISSSQQRPEDAIEANREVLRLLNPVSADVEKMRMTALLAIGDAQLRLQHKEQAEVAYLRALTLDPADIEDQQAREYLKKCYVRAGIGLIECRRMDVHALRENTFFLPEMNATLKPLLEEAIKRAEAEGPPVTREEAGQRGALSDPPPPVLPKRANGD